MSQALQEPASNATQPDPIAVAFHATVTAFADARTPQQASQLIRELRDLAKRHSSDAESAPPTPTIFRVTILEAIAIAHELGAELDPSDIDLLGQFAESLSQYSGRRERFATGECPLLADGRFQAGNLRPLGFPGPDVSAGQLGVERAIRAGIENGLIALGMLPERVEICRALHKCLSNPALIEDYFAGGDALAETEWLRPELQLEAGEPSGRLSDPPPEFAAYFASRFSGEMRQALSELRVQGPLRPLLAFTVPACFTSEDDVEAWHAHAESAMRELEDASLPAAQAFDLLENLVTFELAYMGRDICPLLTQFGDVVATKIVGPLFPDLIEPMPKRKEGPIRIGYISTQLRAHHASTWALGWAGMHRSDFETYALHLGPKLDQKTEIWARTADHFYHLPGAVGPAARLIRSLELDALIYPAIGMHGRDLQFAALRLAPVQCTAWGHPVTSGLPTIDFYLSSDLMEPDNAQAQYREKLVRLPNSGLTYPAIQGEPQNRTRDDFGLPGGFLPIMAQNLQKCLPRWDALFRQVNEATGSPIVFLSRESNDEVQRITRERLERAGVHALWLPRVSSVEFLKLLALCDVSLDPPAWNGGNTTVQALTHGTPVVTLPGEFMRGRHSLAFLKIARAEGLIAPNPSEYVAIASSKERLKTEMAKAEPQRLFLDPEPAEALDEFLMSACRP